METFNVTAWHLKTILESLEDGLKTAKNPEVLNEHGYPYCCGYLEATVSNAVFELKELLNRSES
jgi:hypothetical protein